MDRQPSQSGGRPLGASLYPPVLFFLALLAKENALAYPALFLLTDGILGRPRGSERNRRAWEFSALLIAAGGHPARLRSEAAWVHLCAAAPIPASPGKVTRHRLNPGGNREANHALWRIVITRMSAHEVGKVLFAREHLRAHLFHALGAERVGRAWPAQLRKGALALAQGFLTTSNLLWSLSLLTERSPYADLLRTP